MKLNGNFKETSHDFIFQISLFSPYFFAYLCVCVFFFLNVYTKLSTKVVLHAETTYSVK